MSNQPIEYQFQEDWFNHNAPSLTAIINFIKPTKLLEVGSFEGRSTVFFIENSLKHHPQIELHCIDTWEGALEHIGKYNMKTVEQHFDHNIAIALNCFDGVSMVKHKGTSHQKMIELLAKGYENYFDFIYIDGSHEAPDVLFDALLAHRLVRVGGVIAFDDYLWSPKAATEDDHYLLVKPAVDHYVNTYQQKISVLQNLPIYQLYIQKLKN